MAQRGGCGFQYLSVNWNGLFHFISIHPPRKSVNYVGGVNNGQKLMCPKGGPAQITNCVQGG